MEKRTKEDWMEIYKKVEALRAEGKTQTDACTSLGINPTSYVTAKIRQLGIKSSGMGRPSGNTKNENGSGGFVKFVPESEVKLTLNLENGRSLSFSPEALPIVLKTLNTLG